MSKTISMYEQGVRYAMTVLVKAKDWQEAQHALIEHDRIGPWLLGVHGDDAVEEIQSIIHEAEERLGDRLPY
jgi:hypothetical protein